MQSKKINFAYLFSLLKKISGSTYIHTVTKNIGVYWSRLQVCKSGMFAIILNIIDVPSIA